MAADIKAYLDLIRNANSGETVRDAIINCMRDINAESAIRATNLLITKDDNVTYTAPKGFAFKNVTVNIDGEGEGDPSKTYTYKEFAVTNETENGTYPTPEEGENVAYNKVTVDIEWDDITSGIGDEATMTHTATDEVTGRKYWLPTMDSEYTAVKCVWIGSGAGINLPDYPNGPGSSGNPSGPFIVTFVNETGRVIATVTGIPAGGSVYTTDPELNSKLEGNYAKSVSGKVFSNWAVPAGCSLDYVTSNFTAKPNYTFQTPAGSISKPWSEIIANKGVDLGLGSTINVISKAASIPAMNITSDATCAEGNVHLTALFPSVEVPAGAFNVELMVVAHGEGGTGTTFLATQSLNNSFMINIYDPWAQQVSFMPQGIGRPTGMLSTVYGCDDAVSNYYYKALMRMIYNLLPDEVRSSVKACPSKCQYNLSNLNVSIAEIRAQSGRSWTSLGQRGGNTQVWIPSYGELYTLASDAIANQRTGDFMTADPNIFKPEGSNGYATVKDYSGVWEPSDLSNTSKTIATRTTIIGANRNSMIDVHGLGLAYDNSVSAETLPEKISILSGGSASTGSDNRIYFGFCI